LGNGREDRPQKGVYKTNSTWHHDQRDSEALRDVVNLHGKGYMFIYEQYHFFFLHL
jgi:hypothetical protein